MAGDHDTTELVPEVFEEDGEFAHHCGVDGAVYDLFEEGAFPDVEVRVLYSLQVELKCFKHCVRDLLQLFIVLVVQDLRNRVRQDRCTIVLPHQLLVKPAHVLHLEGLPHLKWKHHFKCLTVLNVL